ncbi:adenylate/guanylate cyclase domain-containing protein [Nocardia thailandica]
MERLTRWTLRSHWGLALIVVGANLVGIATIFVVMWAGGVLSRVGEDWEWVARTIAIYPAIGVVVGVGFALRDRWVYLRWLDQGRKPRPDEARRMLRLPMAVTLRAVALWVPGVVLTTVLVVRYTGYHNAWVLLSGLTLGLLESVGIAFLLVDLMMRPTVPIIAVVLGRTTHWSSSVLVRVLLTWAVSGALPGLIVVVLLADSTTPPVDRVHAALLFSLIGIGVGALATWLLARSVATPMRTMYQALQRITQGELDVRVPVGSASEIGQLEHSVNELAATLREQMHTEDVFSRHVGPTVAERALAASTDLTGDVRVVSALFVDVTGSVELSATLPPQVFVDKLNRLLATVVAATEANGGLVNKFAGDAALCIFGAPLALHDDATPALRAARRIRDEVLAVGEVDIGIGVARGRVFAGDVGTDTRLEFTVIGDAVNEAARLTTEAKAAPRRILVSDAVIRASTPYERARWEYFDDLLLRGMTAPTACWTDHADAAAPRPITGPIPAGRAGEAIPPTTAAAPDR